jgi:cytochrome c oxidase assembly protein subunit 15
LQAILGIVTLLEQSPIPLALAHQMAAILLFTIAVVHAQRLHHHAAEPAIKPAEAFQ